MPEKGSRYEGVAAFTASDDRPSFAGLRPRAIPETPGVVEHVVSSGERLDLLARHYYGNDRDWWRIVDANPWMLREATTTGERFAGHLHLTGLEGRTILIPRART